MTSYWARWRLKSPASRFCLLNRLFRHRSKKTSKLRVTGLFVGKSPVKGEFPHKGRVTRKMFPFDDVTVFWLYSAWKESHRMTHKNYLIQFKNSSHISSIYENPCYVEAKFMEGKSNTQQLITYNMRVILICDFHHKCYTATFSRFP